MIERPAGAVVTPHRARVPQRAREFGRKPNNPGILQKKRLPRERRACRALLLPLGHPERPVEAEGQHRLRRHLDGTALGNDLREHSGPGARARSDGRALSTARDGADDGAVRLLAPTPDFPFWLMSAASILYRLWWMVTVCRSSTRSEAPRNWPPFEADLMTTLARDPRGITTLPFASRASRVSWASKRCPSAAVPESIPSFIRIDISLPAGNS
jgi:hypothetical protein